MFARIEVKDRKEAALIKRGLEHDQTRALVAIMGVLLPLSDRERKRVLTFVADKLDE